MEVGGEPLKNPGDWDLLIVAALVKNQNSNMASSEISASDHLLLRGVRKSTIFQNVNYLQNLVLVALIKKKIGIYYMMGGTNIIIGCFYCIWRAKKEALVSTQYYGVLHG